MKLPRNFKQVYADLRYENEQAVKPTEDKNHIGIEMEMITKVPQEILAWELIKAGLQKYVTIKSDGSIRYNHNTEYNVELCLLIPQNMVARIVPRVAEVLAICNAKTNSSCGLHVHLDMRHRNVERCYKALVDKLDFLYTFITPTRKRDSSYCKRNETNDFNECLESFDRYLAINPEAYGKYETLEVRMHQGTVDGSKIVSWVKALTTIVEAA